MMSEFEMMNILHHPRLTRLVEVYDYKDGMTLISELATGGELLDVITKQKYITEIEIARFIQQVMRSTSVVITCHDGFEPFMSSIVFDILKEEGRSQLFSN